MPSATNILITGLPGSGKTTVFRRLVDKLGHLNPVGFFTAEIRKGGERQGFSISRLIAGLKQRSDVQLFTLTRENQDETVRKICSILSALE